MSRGTDAHRALVYMSAMPVKNAVLECHTNLEGLNSRSLPCPERKVLDCIRHVVETEFKMSCTNGDLAIDTEHAFTTSIRRWGSSGWRRNSRW